MKVLSLILSIAILGIGCSKSSNENKTESDKTNIQITSEGVFKNLELIKELREKSVDTLELAGSKYLLRSESFRKLTRNTDLDTNLLRVYIHFAKFPFFDAHNSKRLPLDYGYNENIKFIRAYIIQSPNIWITKVSIMDISPPFMLLSNAGPKWRHNSLVEVILELEYNGQKKFIKESPITIQVPKP